MKILHTADLHLDAVMGTQFPSSVASKRRDELLNTFGRMVTYAAQIGVRVFLIAGDLFDTPHPSPRAEQYVLGQIAAHPEIDFLVLGSTHCGSYIPQDPPKNYHTFPQRSLGYYRYDNIVICGTENNAAYHELKLSSEQVNIVMLHGAISDAITDLSVVNLKFWQNAGIDYMALGHVHRAEKNALDARGVWAYCGTPEGLGFEDVGPKGFMLIEVQDKKLSSVFMPFAQRSIHTVSVDVSRLLHLHDIEKQVQNTVSSLSDSDLVRITLRGVADPNLHIDTDRINHSLGGRFFYSEVQNETNISLRPDAYALDKSLRGEFVRTVLSSGLNRADMERIIRCGIQALSGEEVDE